MSANKPEETRLHVATRREFLVVTSTAIAGIATTSLGATVMRIPGVDSGAMPVLAVGYWDGLVRGDGSNAPASHISEAVPGRGDNLFRGASAMVTVQGFWRAPARRGSPVTLSLIPLYPADDPVTGRKMPVIGWSASLDGDRMRGALHTRFTVPLDSAGRVEIAVEKREATRSRAVRGATASSLDQLRTLSADASADLVFGLDQAPIALQKGVYFIGLREGSIAETPDWSRLHVTQLRSTDSVAPLEAGVLVDDSGNPPTFDYIVVKIEPWGVGGV